MTPSALEAWVLRVVDQVARGEHTEDSRIELKREWPKPENAARLIAGHANAARGASILWIIGLDESTGVHGAPKEELANWYNSVKQSFDGFPPSLYDLNVPANGKTLVALLFETDRAPYVVRNPVFGSPGGGSVEREVPWREGRRTLSARRDHLLRLLVPTTDLPEVEVLSCAVSASMDQLADKTEVEKWDLHGTLYLSPRGNEVVIPFHRTKLTVIQGQRQCISLWRHFRMFPPSRFDTSGGSFGTKVDSVTVGATSSEVILSGPGMVHFTADAQFPFADIYHDQALELRLVLSIVGAMAPLSLSVSMTPTATGKNIQMAWVHSEES
jgi:hypothetical protein